MSVRTPEQRRGELVALFRRLGPDHRCPLAAERTKIVFGSGNADADLMFVGEAPGASEDREGKPFVGRAGKLLDTLLEEIGLERSDTFIANVLMCRPPGNRDPLPDEIEECSPFLFRKIELIEPLVVCTLGNFALKLLTGSKLGITKVHGRPQTREIAGRTVQLYPLFHPAAALRTESVRDLLRADFARLPALLEEARRAAPPASDAPQLGPGLPKPAAPGAAAGGVAAGGVGAASAAGADPAAEPDRDQLDLFG